MRVLSRKGRALLKLGNYPAAHLAFSEVLDSPRINPKSQFGSKDIKNETDLSSADEDSIRTDVKAGVKQVLLAKVMFNRLIMLESQSDHKQFSSTADDLLKLSPELREAQLFKASALCKLQEWSNAKSFIESCVCEKPVCIQKTHSHPAASIPVGAKSALAWTYNKPRERSSNTSLKTTNFAVNIPDVVNACLAMGGKLAKPYVWALKNEKHSRFLCAETMDVIKNLLLSLRMKIFDTNISDTEQELKDWVWVKEELNKLTNMVTVKNSADSNFRAGNFSEALNSYREFVKIDTEANLWNAVM